MGCGGQTIAMGKTPIEWAEHSVNPIRARLNGRSGHHCVKISPGCKNCYASRLQPRFGMPPYELGQRQGVELYLERAVLEEVRRRQTPTKYFWCDMTDLFLDEVPREWIKAINGVCMDTPQHTHMILTKRAERMREEVESCPFPPNVWLGVSVEDQKTADERIPLLLQTPAAIRFVSYEPALNHVTFRSLAKSDFDRLDALRGIVHDGARTPRAIGTSSKLDWLIVGGESGPGARTCDVAWLRSAIRQCQAAKVPVFCKQLGANVWDRNDAGFEGDTTTSWPMDTCTEDENEFEARYQGAGVRIHLKDRKGGDPAEWPADLRVREFPTVRP